MRVRSHTQGEAFNLTLDFERAFITTPGRRYFASVYTLVNCPKAECEAGKDSISVKVRDGATGSFGEVYLINRIRDTKWVREEFSFKANADRTYVRRYFE